MVCMMLTVGLNCCTGTGVPVCVCVCLRSCIRVWIHNVCMYKQVTSGSWTKMRPGQGAQMR